MDILRFATAGSVDDGKSTLIGRLLYDTKTVFEDQLDAVERVSRDRGEEYTNLALLTDGLRAEREQGITIDVAYRYFATPRRKFIIADTPGHIQYTRNMVTGASTADLALVLVDARKGLVEQSRRHAFLATLLQVPAHRPRRQQDGPRRLQPGGLRADPPGVRRLRDEAPGARPRGHPRVGAQGRQRRDPLRQDALVRRREPAALPREHPRRERPQPHRHPLPGPVRHPPDVRRLPRLPRLRRSGRRRRPQEGRRRHGPALGLLAPASPPSRRRTARSTRRSRPCRSPCGSRTRSTSPAET